mmetsp:Transcript_14324/g.35971  ORF Transcript_14324/g.35971 Transcript_14324/m.35971 type:complete len:278 (-) Transcript_14324:336-1169(-)
MEQYDTRHKRPIPTIANRLVEGTNFQVECFSIGTGGYAARLHNWRNIGIFAVTSRPFGEYNILQSFVETNCFSVSSRQDCLAGNLPGRFQAQRTTDAHHGTRNSQPVEQPQGSFARNALESGDLSVLFDTNNGSRIRTGWLDYFFGQFGGSVEAGNPARYLATGVLSKAVSDGTFLVECSLSALSRQETQSSAAAHRFHEVRCHAVAGGDNRLLRLRLFVDDRHGVLFLLFDLQSDDAPPADGHFYPILRESLLPLWGPALSVRKATLVSQRLVSQK